MDILQTKRTWVFWGGEGTPSVFDGKTQKTQQSTLEKKKKKGKIDTENRRRFRRLQRRFLLVHILSLFSSFFIFFKIKWKIFFVSFFEASHDADDGPSPATHKKKKKGIYIVSSRAPFFKEERRTWVWRFLCLITRSSFSFWYHTQ